MMNLLFLQIPIYDRVDAPLIFRLRFIPKATLLILPGVNGLLCTIVLNTDYSPEKGEISISPETPVLTRYNTSRSGGTAC